MLIDLPDVEDTHELLVICVTVSKQLLQNERHADMVADIVGADAAGRAKEAVKAKMQS